MSLAADRHDRSPARPRDTHDRRDGEDTKDPRDRRERGVARNADGRNAGEDALGWPTGRTSGETRVFGIRHHGPGSARSLRLALEEFRPDTILIEGPADADPLVAYVSADGMSPPVALLAYNPATPSRAAFWPYAVFSPEWQALQYAVEQEVPVRFCDLPAGIALAVDDEPARRDALADLAAAAGYDDAERWWDAVVESSSDTATFEAITEAMSALREAATAETDPTDAGVTTDNAVGVAVEHNGDTRDAAPKPAETPPPVVDAHTLRREAYMRQVLRKALKEGAERVAVVCGAWHAPALSGPLGPATADGRLLKGLPKIKATLTWVPWTHSRLATASGYGAGVASPGWYHHLFTATERPIAAWLTKVAGALRAHDLPVSSAHIIEAIRLADTLATLRGRPLAGLSEVTEATRAVLCEGDETMLRLIDEELVVGEALGTVPLDTPTVALDADLRARIRSLRMKQQALMKTVELDLRAERDIAKSHLLHRLRLLGIDWGTRTASETRSTGTFRETWALEWRPELAVAVIEAARWGTTVQSAAEAKVLDTAERADSGVGELTDALEQALSADLPGATEGLIDRLGSAVALDHDVTHLLRALPALVRTLRYGDVRGTDTATLARVADSMLVRICAGLPAAVTGLGAEMALELRALLDTAHTAIHTRDDARATERWLGALDRLADREDVHGVLVGRVVRLLADTGRIDTDEAARRLSAALSIGNTAAEKAAWVDGFVGGRGLVLVHDRALLRLIDDWLTGLTDEQFLEVLPLLRRTFGAFESGERRAIGQAVRDGGPAPASETTTDIDPRRGAQTMRIVAEILGVPA
ncbi:DUF5682 family protein [Nocardia brevicatena]|uniref:DUF5682 family protein n=1 Tax=Nocardia brevicatena TaxID=37327 RepID=UPI0002F31AC9|nr:DUF5682 family protein [Nocardia brevicatena]